MTHPTDDDLPDLEQISSGSIRVEGTTMVLVDDVDHVLVRAWDRAHLELPPISCIDAEQVSFLRSSGIALVIRVAKQAEARDGRTKVELRRPSRPALRPLQAMGVDSMVSITT